MKIQYDNNLNPTFGIKVKTSNLFQMAAHKIFNEEGYEGYRRTTILLNDNIPKYIGSKGYKYYADLAIKKIVAKYPDIENAINTAKHIIEKNPRADKSELYDAIKPVIDKVGEEVDIVI